MEASELPAGLSTALWDEAFVELKKLARSRLYASGPFTQLNTTALVHESYLKLAGRSADLTFPSRNHFFAYASKAMRSIIVDLVRQRNAERHGGALLRVTLDACVAQELAGADDPVHVNDALQALEQVEPRLARVVEMRYFAGMTELEIAEVLGLTERTVRRDWDKARAILKCMLE